MIFSIPYLPLGHMSTRAAAGPPRAPGRGATAERRPHQERLSSMHPAGQSASIKVALDQRRAQHRQLTGSLPQAVHRNPQLTQSPKTAPMLRCRNWKRFSLSYVHLCYNYLCLIWLMSRSKCSICGRLHASGGVPFSSHCAATKLLLS